MMSKFEKLVGVALLVGITILSVAMVGVATGACTPAARELAVVRGLNVAKCVLEHQDEDEAIVVAKCTEENVSPDDVVRMLSEARSQTQKAAARRAGCPPALDGGR